MRLVLLAAILFLGLTLANAFAYRADLDRLASSAYVPVHLRQHWSAHAALDNAIWREIGAIVVTAVLYGAVTGLGRGSSSSQLR